MGNDLLSTYDRLRDLLVTAQAKTRAAKAEYDKALAHEQDVAADLTRTRDALQAALSTPGAPSDSCATPAAASDGTVSTGDSTASTSDGASTGQQSAGDAGNAAQQDGAQVAPTPPAPAGVTQSIWELILVIPRDGDVSMDDLREKFNITDAAINNRVTKAKKAGFVGSAGWGRYCLTDKGKKLQEQRLRVVNGG